MNIISKIVLMLIGSCLTNNAFFAQGISGSWSKASSEGFTPKADLSSNVIGNKIYAIGGESLYVALNSLNVYDPDLDVWSTPKTTGIFIPHRCHTSEVIGDKIYVIGGESNGGLITDVQVFDPATNSWNTLSTTGSFTPRRFLSSCVVNDKIYVIGGDTGDYVPTNILEIFDPANNSWSRPKTTGTFIPRDGHSSCSINNKIYVIGGGDEKGTYYGLQIFDPETNTWDFPNITGTYTPRALFSACVLGGKIYTVGGFNSSGPFSTIEVFDPINNSWSTPQTTGHFTPRGWLTSDIIDGASPRIYSIGGDNNAYYLNTNEFFTPSTSDVPNVSSNETFISPNPTSGIINIYNILTDVKRIIIMNILGNKVLEIEGIHKPNLTFDLSNFPAGIYYVKLVTTNSVVIRKIMKE